MVNFYRLIVVCFSFFAGVVLAAVPTITEYKMSPYPPGDTWYPSAEEACGAYVSYRTANDNTFDVQMVSIGPGGGYCTIKLTQRGTTYSQQTDIPINSRGGACPANSVKMNGECVCHAGFEERNGKCEAPDKCAGVSESCAAAAGKRRRWGSNSGSQGFYCLPPPDDFFWDQPKYPGCQIGCELQDDGGGVEKEEYGGRTYYSGLGTETGGTCYLGGANDPDRPPDVAPKPPAEPQDERCEGFKGEVNGQTVCVPAKAATGDQKSDSKTNSDGTSSKTESSTTCDGAKCTTTTTTTNKDANGNATGSSTNVVVVPQGDYCQKNPGSQVCAAVTGSPTPGAGNGTGGGSGGGNCTGSNCSDTSGPSGPGAVGIPGTGGGGAIGELYERKYPDGPVALWNQKSAELKNSGLAAVAGKLMPDVQDGGSPPVFDLDFNFGGSLGNLGGGNIAPDGNFWMIIKSIVILCSLILARKIIFGG